MTLRRFLLEHYITKPEDLTWVIVNGRITEDWSQELRKGDTVEVLWPNVGRRLWLYPEPPITGSGNG